MLGILGSIGAHALLDRVFAAVMVILHRPPTDWDVGDLIGAEAGRHRRHLLLGHELHATRFDNVTPVGALRLLVGVEALVGLVVAWSASFTFLQMQMYWQEHGKK